MKNGKKVLKVKNRKSSAYPGLGQDAPHKSPGGSPKWYKKVLLISWLDYSQYLVFFPQALKSTIINPSSTGYRRKMSHNHQKPHQGLLSRMRLFFCLRWMVAPQWGVQWVLDIPTNPLTSVVHLKRGAPARQKSQRNQTSPLTYMKDRLKQQHGKQNNTYFKNGQRTTQKHERNIHASKPAPQQTADSSIGETDGLSLMVPESWELGETPEQKSRD